MEANRGDDSRRQAGEDVDIFPKSCFQRYVDGRVCPGMATRRSFSAGRWAVAYPCPYPPTTVQQRTEQAKPNFRDADFYKAK